MKKQDCSGASCTLSNMIFDVSRQHRQVDLDGIGVCDPKLTTAPIIGPVKRVIAIGDIHGDLKLALQSLVIAKVIPYHADYFNGRKTPQQLYKKLHKIRWIGEDTYVVQVGDQIDRCRPYRQGQTCMDDDATFDDEPSDIVIMDFFTHLHLLAQKDGGAVISLFGNHELMNLTGKMTYVSKAGIKQFEGVVDSEDGKMRSGLEGRKKFFRRGGPYSQFMACSRHSVVIVGSTLFAHAGVIEQFIRNLDKKPTRQTILDINSSVKKWVLGMINSDNIKYVVGSNDSLFWNRVMGSIPSDTDKNANSYEDTCVSSLDGVLKLLSLDRMVIGHTPFIQGGVSPACNSKLFRVDVGASAAFRAWKHGPNDGKPRVLEIVNDHIGKPEVRVIE